MSNTIYKFEKRLLQMHIEPLTQDASNILISMLISIPTICIDPIGYDHANIHYSYFIIGLNEEGITRDLLSCRE